ncbi:zinc finger and BTB domain-containing protein 47 [Microdochium nivale]|nr:zinc finger and BTB domain-containing protein 47 [Microdochium nivale]
MKGRPVDQLVYEFMFPKPRATDPPNFHSLLHRHLILEVRQEVQAYFGHISTQEAKYPGLDYSQRIHRIRLSRWPWHRRLFRAFDGLGLTRSEIATLTKWEGTRWAKERFERDSGISIKDSAGDGIEDWVEVEDRASVARARQTKELHDNQLAVERADEDMEHDTYNEEEEEDEDEEEEEGAETRGAEEAADDDESEGELESIGVALNERLRERAARHQAGDTSEPLDEEWEQWLKNAIESGELPFLADQILSRPENSTPVPQALFPPRMLSAARAGNWREIPDFLHEMLRRTLETENAARNATRASIAFARHRQTAALNSNPYLGTLDTSEARRRTYSDLRLPIGETGPAPTSSIRSSHMAEPRA